MPRLQHLVRSSLLVILIYGLNKVTGLIKLLLMTAIFGTGPIADAFTAANQLPELLLAMISGGALAAAFIPVYTNHLQPASSPLLFGSPGEPAENSPTTRIDSDRRGTSSSRQLAHTILNLIMVVMGVTCGIASLFAPWITATLLVPEFAPEQQLLTAELMRILLIASVLIAVAGVLTSLLHAHQRFLVPAWGTVLIDLGQIVGLWLLEPLWGIYGVAWGSVLGALMLVAVQIPAYVRQKIGYRPQLTLHLQGVREVLHLMGPRVITLGTYQAVDLVIIRLASQLPAGSISAYFYAMLAMVYMPRSLFGHAIGNVIFPSMAEHFNEGRQRDMKQVAVQGLRAVWGLVIPAAVGLLALGQPAIAFVFERGAFDASSTNLVYLLMTIMAVRLICDATQDVISLIFYARHDTYTPMWASLGWMVLNIGLSLRLVGPYGVAGLAWAGAISSLLLAATLYLLGQAAVNGLNETMLGSTLGRLALASAGMGGVIVAVRQLNVDPLPLLALASGSGGVAFLLIYLVLGRQDLRFLWQMLFGHKKSPAH